MSQIHKNFTDCQVKEFLNKYIAKEIDQAYLQKILGLKRRRLFDLLKKYKDDPQNFSIQYKRTQPKRLSSDIEQTIIEELSIDQKIIENKDVPLKSYNYSYIKNRLENNFNKKVSLPTIIKRAKENGFYLKKRDKPKKHEREVLTDFTGELIQHDSSIHLWAPAAKEKWYLITSIDDYSRFLLYATLVRKETAWTHIDALQSLILQFGLPYQYYVDSHSIFRFVRDRDSTWNRAHLITDQATPQWKQVLNDCHIKVIHALSPQAKGKIERPYLWLQDHLVRSCVRENVTDIKHGQRILDLELRRYNYKQVHSTTQQIPYIRFKDAQDQKKTLFRKFEVLEPFNNYNDIFCLRLDRVTEPYRKISINNLVLKVKNVNPREIVQLRIFPLKNGFSQIRFWVKNKLVDSQKVKNSDLKGVHF